MNIPQVSTACCGQSLRTASLIIAWFLSVLVGIVWSLYLSILPTLHNEFNHGFDRMSHALSSVVGMILTYFFIEHCLLLYGLLKKQHYFLLPWIVMTCITIGVGIGVSALLLILTFCVSAVALLFFVPNSLLTSGLIYCLLVISSYYQEIRIENSNNENSNVQTI